MLKKFLVVIAVLALAAGSVYAGETTVGGHVKMTLFDYVSGDRVTPGNVKSDTQYAGLSFRELVLYISHELTDSISLDIQPFFSASTGATPKFGDNIGEQITAPGDREDAFGGFVKAVAKISLPDGYEISAGIVKPKFTLEYGGELFWEDVIDGSKFATNNYLGALHDAGIEVYKTFEAGDVSLPVSLYLLNGGYEIGDNNNQPSVMLHVEPEIGPLKLTGSFLAGRYDAAELKGVTRWSGGLLVDYEGLSLRAEYAGGKWEKSISGSKDATPYGYYVQLSYKVFPWLRLTFHHDVADHNFNGFFYTAPGGEKYITNIPSAQIYLADSAVIILQVSIADWERTDGSDTLQFVRPVLGTRITF